jgi:hypothetical protein
MFGLLCNIGSVPPIIMSRHCQNLLWLIRSCINRAILIQWRNLTFVHPPAVERNACKQYSRVPPCWRLCRDEQIECRPKRLCASECNRQTYTTSLYTVKITATTCWVAKCCAVGTSKARYSACTLLWLLDTSLKYICVGVINCSLAE